MRFRRTPILMIFWLFPWFGILLNYIYLKRALARLQAMPATRPAHVSASLAAFNSTADPTEPHSAAAFAGSAPDQPLLRLPVPRRVRISKSGRIVLWTSAFGLSLFVVPFAASAYHQWALYQSFSNVGGLGWGIALEGVVALAACGIWRGQVRECDLLKNGQAAMGHVLRQWTDEKRNSSVEYEFTDFMGSLHRGVAFDRTGKLFSGMPLLVFYDRADPKRQLAYCSTLHEVLA